MRRIIKIACPHCNKENKLDIQIKYETEHKEVFYCKECNKEFTAIVRELISVTAYILTKEISQ